MCEHRQGKREAEEADKVEVAPGATVASLRRFRAALIEPTVSDVDGVPIEEPETRRVRSCCRCYAFGMHDDCDSGRRVSDGSRLALYQTLSLLYRVPSKLSLSTECPSL